MGALVATSARGGSLPSQWTVGADGELTILSPATTGRILEVEVAAGHNDDVVFEVTKGGVPQLQLYADSGLDANILGLGDGTGTPQPADAILDITRFTGQTAPLIQATTNLGSLLFKVLPGGAIVTAQHAAPADADLAAGEMAVWFDQTNGAAKLMVKARDANSVIVTGSLALA